MKKFSFSLQRLLDYKEQVLDIERAVLSDMNAALNRLIDELARLREERAKRAEEYRETLQKSVTPLELQTHSNYMRMLEENISQKETQIEMQRQAVENQTDKVRDVKIEISTMEKLREKKLEEYNYLDNKAQEQFIEEFVSNAKAVSQGNI